LASQNRQSAEGELRKEEMKQMIKPTVLMFALFAFAGCSSAQTAPAKAQAKDQPAPQLEASLSQHGQMMMKEFYELGTVRGMGHVTLTALVISAPIGSHKTKGLKIEVSESGQFERDNSSFLDVDELESLSQSLTSMSDAAAKWNAADHAPYTEVIYRPKGELQIGFFRKGNDVNAFCTSGSIGSATAYFKVEQLREWKSFVDQAIMLLKTK
jgi:hypothetical protein